jgi:imidazolonepropionase-like amidohydrolase
MLAVRGAGLFDGVTSARGPVLILIESGRIVDVDTSGARPPNHAELVDLGGATLLPGLIDAHVHLAFQPDADDLVRDLLDVDDEALLERMHANAARALAAGITTVRDLGDRRFLAGQLRERYQGGAVVGPEVLWSGPPITTSGGHCWFLGGEADGPDAIRAAVAERADHGVDIIKIMATGGLLTPGLGLHESQYGFAELEIAVQVAHEHGLPITAHAHGPHGIADAVTAGVDGVEHCTFVTVDGVSMEENTVHRLAASGTFVGATEAWLPDGPPLPPVAAGRLEQCWRNFARMHRAGVQVVCCSDAGIGPRKPHDVLPHGLILFSRMGFTNAEALTSATSLAARACGVADRKGRLLPGYDADLLAVAGDPIVNLHALLDVQAVFCSGRRLTQPGGFQLQR